ncbi:unnamed protein product [Fusarium venenatum]|uniref:Uncharacterized protein n=1 Tax=Fusarium venenatum TaxID=56646 RepID=A0A2L2THU9_9HYPO|nr:uncharacterized protein FVRRES_09646 [Fusarium venenatum]CEI69569.1 unnamed protein product [Fusarium venenatum]
MNELPNLVGPHLVNGSSTVCLALLEQDLVLPLRHVGRVDITSRLTAETSSGLASWQTVDGGHVNTGSSVDLESWLGAVDFKVDAGARVSESLVSGDARERLDFAGGDEVVANSEVAGGRESHLCVGDGLLSTRVEVRVVGHVDDCLISATNELGLVLHCENSDILAVDLLCARCVSDSDLYGAGVSLIAILASKRKSNALSALQTLNTRNLTGANGLGAVPDASAPANSAAVEMVLSIVGGKNDFLAIEAVNSSVLDTVGNAANGHAKVGRVMLLIVFLGGEALNDVDAVDDKRLNNGAEGQESD